MAVRRGVQRTIDENIKAGGEESTIEASHREELYKNLGMKQRRTTENSTFYNKWPKRKILERA